LAAAWFVGWLIALAKLQLVQRLLQWLIPAVRGVAQCQSADNQLFQLKRTVAGLVQKNSN